MSNNWTAGNTIIPNTTDAAIAGVESRKIAITQAINSEKNVILDKINHEYRIIGETSYNLYVDGTYDVKKITSMLDNVKDLHKSLDEQEAKLKEFLERYDEELSILQAAKSKGQYNCKSCNTAYIPGQMAFCVKCGAKLPDDNNEENATESGVQSLCSKCNAALRPDAVFCSVCGSSV